MQFANYNEPAWKIDLISEINDWARKRDRAIKRAGGERTIHTQSNPLFPDVLLFGDETSGNIIQGWELKFPDTAITDQSFKENAEEKAKILKLNSFLLWNVTCAQLYILDSEGSETLLHTWNDLSHITKREQVEPAKGEWVKMLQKMLGDLCDFFEQGIIRSVSVYDSLTGDEIAEFILKHRNSVAAELGQERGRDADFDDRITLWWRSSHRDYPSEHDACVVLASINLIVWLNKFIFAQVLKLFYQQASKVKDINFGTNINQAIALFESISSDCDFWNVFRSQLGQEKIPNIAWQDLVAFNRFLCEFDFNKIDQEILHKLLQAIVYRWKRKVAGQFATPIELAKLLVYLTVRNKTLNVLDPCCGTGTIARAAYDIKKEFQINPETALASTWASDKFAFPLHMATLAMVEPINMGKTLNIFMEDATSLEQGSQVSLNNPFDGRVVEAELPRMNYIVSNLPFVQQEDLAILNPGIRDINNFIRERTNKGVILDARSDLYVYLPFYLWRVLEDNGLMGIIIYNAWLSTDYATIFRHHLSNFFQIEYVITSAHGRWFRETDVVTNIVLLQKRSEEEVTNNEGRTEEITNFVTINRPLSDIYSHGSIRELTSEIRSANPTTSDISKRCYQRIDINRLEALGLRWSALFADCSWLPQIADRLIRANSLFEIRRGERRGWDPLFYPEEEHRIEHEYIQRVLKSPRSVNGLMANTDADAFCCARSVEELEGFGHTGALQWIRRFENQNNKVGIPLTQSLQRAGIHWYTMLPNTMADMVTSINPDERLFVARLETRSFVNQRLTRFTTRGQNVNVPLCHALLNSILGIFYLEALGFGRGLGVLDLNARKLARDLHMFNPSLLDDENTRNILENSNPLLNRDLLPIEAELEQEDRIAFDNAILEAYGIPDLRDSIVDAFLTLFRIRKAVNF